MSVLGIDVSHHNGSIDWYAVARSPARFAFVKATEGGTFVDPLFATNWPAVRDVGILRGAYHFAHPGGDPEVQAAHFASVIGQTSWGELPPALDLEADDGQPAQAIVDWTLAFIAKAEALLGCSLIMYTGGLWRRIGSPKAAVLSSRLLWTARYGPAAPAPLAPWNNWSFWQFTDGRSGAVQTIPGVSGPCDCDWYQGEVADLQSLSDKMADGGPAPSAPAPVAAGNWPGRVFVWPSTPAIRGSDVLAWQTGTAARGFAVTADGIYGPESKAACIAFQRHAGLSPDGIVGRDTWNATFDDRAA